MKLQETSSPISACRLSVIASLLLCGASSASADAWQGWHVGVGLIGMDAEATIDAGAGKYVSGPDSDPGFIALHGGYTFGVLGAADGNHGFRFGTQLDLGFGGSSDTADDPDFGDLEIDANFYLSGVVRFGYTWDTVWLYGLVGLSGSDFFVSEAGDDTDHLILAGVVGVGAEWRFHENWSVQIEFLGGGDGDSEDDFGGEKRDVNVESAALKIGMNWRF